MLLQNSIAFLFYSNLQAEKSFSAFQIKMQIRLLIRYSIMIFNAAFNKVSFVLPKGK